MQYTIFYKKPCLWIFPFFFEPRLIISPSKLHFLTKIFFFQWPSIRLIGKYQQKNPEEIRCCTHFFIRTNFLYFHTFFKVRLIISPPKLHFLTKIIFSTDPVSDWLENTNKKFLRKLGAVHIFYKKQFPVFLYFFSN